MKDKKSTCPVCSSSIEYFGEGGYGVCSNNECKFEVHVEGCNGIEDCDEMKLKKEEGDKLHVMSD